MDVVATIAVEQADPTGEFSSHPSDHLFYLVFQLVQRRQALIADALDVLGLDLSRWRPILFVGLFGPCSMKDLSRLSGIDRTTLTRTVDHLVREGLMERKGAANDRRRVILHLTPAGQEALGRGLEIKGDLNRLFLRDVAEPAQRALCRELEAILTTMVANDGLATALTRLDLKALEMSEG